MNVGLVGFLGSGKSTLYRAAAKGMAKGDVTAVPVPDTRFDQIVAQVKPKKATPATITFHDNIEGFQGDSAKKISQHAIDNCRKMDLILHVVRGFDNPIYPYFSEVNPLRDAQALEEEFLLLDLQVVENRLTKLKRSAATKTPGSPEYNEKMIFDRLLEPLSEGTPIKDMDLSEEELNSLKGFQFLSAKTIVTAINVPEGDVNDSNLQSEVDKRNQAGMPTFIVSAPIEEEIAQLEADDQAEFLKDLGIEQPASDKVIKTIYDALGLITFFTAGETDTRAWPLRVGSTAVKAADTIHSDIAKGFIRAEVVHFQDYVDSGSLDDAYKEKKMKLEGKEYIVQDGDLLHIRNKT